MELFQREKLARTETDKPLAVGNTVIPSETLAEVTRIHPVSQYTPYGTRRAEKYCSNDQGGNHDQSPLQGETFTPGVPVKSDNSDTEYQRLEEKPDYL